MNFLTDSISSGVMQMNFPETGDAGQELTLRCEQLASVVQNASDPAHLLQSNNTSSSLMIGKVTGWIRERSRGAIAAA
jgi:hypothetical protein